MNRSKLIIVGAVIVIGAIALVLVLLFTSKGATVTNNSTGSTNEVKTNGVLASVNACDILTADIAKSILGDAAEKGDLPVNQTATKDVAVSDCVYTAKIDPAGKISIANKKGASVLVRAAITGAGAKTNKDQFGDLRPKGVQDVSGLGDSAYYNVEFGQLNVLKGGNWYIITSYSGSLKGTLDANKLLVSKLPLK